jgi:hypothetical protein
MLVHVPLPATYYSESQSPVVPFVRNSVMANIIQRKSYQNPFFSLRYVCLDQIVAPNVVTSQKYEHLSQILFRASGFGLNLKLVCLIPFCLAF